MPLRRSGILSIFFDLDRFAESLLRTQRARSDPIVWIQMPKRVTGKNVWKLALKDAYETIVKWLLTLAVRIRIKIYKRKKWTEEKKRLAFFVISSCTAACFKSESNCWRLREVPLERKSTWPIALWLCLRCR